MDDKPFDSLLKKKQCVRWGESLSRIDGVTHLAQATEGAGMDGQQVDCTVNARTSRRSTRRDVLWGLAGGLAVVPLGLQGGHEAAAEKQVKAAGKQFKTVTRSFSNGAAITILDAGAANPYPSTIQVSGLKKGKVKNVDVTIRGFSHTHTNDVDIMLVAPGGRNAVILSEVGNHGAVTNLTIELDDQAAAPLGTTALTSGSFQPTDLAEHGTGNPFTGAPTPSGQVALSTFKGINPNGQWELYVFDNVGSDSGSISNGWTLQITARVRK
jgi:subtilisin-like proprotein convertase family protein